MTRKGEDRAQGFAKQSVKNSARHPSQSSPDHQEHGDLTRSDRSLTGKDEPEGPNAPDPDRPAPEDRYKP